MKRILLINPPFNRLKGIRAKYFPIGLGYLGAALKKNGFYVRIYNTEIGNPSENLICPPMEKVVSYYNKYIESLNNPDHYVWKNVENTISDFKPDIVGISVMTAKYGSALKISRICKSITKKIVVVWGGPHPTLLPEESLENDTVDFVVRGEGELAFPALCANLNGDIKTIKGISFKKENRIIHNSQMPLIEELDSLPFMGRELALNKEQYSNDDFGVITTSRGCIFRCTYCCAPKIWGKKIRHRSPENVIKEIIKIQKEYHTDTLMFWDDSFTVDKAYTKSLCNKIIGKRLNIRFGCTTRVNLVDNELLKIMRKAGCYNIDFGIESGSKRILDLIKKDISFEQIEHAAKLCRKNNINWNAFFMIGFPQETKQDIIDSMKYFKKLRPSEASLSIFTPYPGTELFKVAKNYGLINDKVDWSSYSHHSSENSFVKDLTKEELSELYKKFILIIARQKKSFLSRFFIRKTLLSFYFNHPRYFVLKVIQKIHAIIK